MPRKGIGNSLANSNARSLKGSNGHHDVNVAREVLRVDECDVIEAQTLGGSGMPCDPGYWLVSTSTNAKFDAHLSLPLGPTRGSPGIVNLFALECYSGSAETGRPSAGRPSSTSSPA